MNVYKPGDLFVFPSGFETIVMEVNERNWPIKVKAVHPDPALGKRGWFLENDEWVVFSYDILNYN